MSNLFKNIKHDLTMGIVKKYKILLCIFIFSIFSSMKLMKLASKYIENGVFTEKPGWLEYIFYALKGMKDYNPKDGPFEIPYLLMTFYFLITLLIGDYAVVDLNKSGISILVRTKSRYSWMISKFVWAAACVTIAFSILLLVTLGFACVSTKSMNIFSNNIVFETLLGLELQGESIKMLWWGILAAYISAIGISFLQIIICMYATPLLGIAAVMGMWIMSSYVTNSFLIGNYAMLQRNKMFVNGKIDLALTFKVDLIIMIFAVVIGIIYFRRRDIYGN